MRSNSVPKLMLIINPTAGKNQARNQVFNLINYFFTTGNHVTVFPTQGSGDGTKFTEEYAEEYDRVVCVGGDGTLNEVVAGLMTLPEDKRPILGYVPAGTTNDFASTLGISPRMEESMQQIVDGEPFTATSVDLTDSILPMLLRWALLHGWHTPRTSQSKTALATARICWTGHVS